MSAITNGGGETDTNKNSTGAERRGLQQDKPAGSFKFKLVYKISKLFIAVPAVGCLLATAAHYVRWRRGIKLRNGT